MPARCARHRVRVKPNQCPLPFITTTPGFALIGFFIPVGRARRIIGSTGLAFNLDSLFNPQRRIPCSWDTDLIKNWSVSPEAQLWYEFCHAPTNQIYFTKSIEWVFLRWFVRHQPSFFWIPPTFASNAGHILTTPLLKKAKDFNKNQNAAGESEWCAIDAGVAIGNFTPK